MSDENHVSILDRIEAIDKGAGLTLREQDKSTQFSYQTVPFYNKFRILRVDADGLTNAPRLSCWADDGFRLLLLHDASSIYSVNKLESLNLDTNQISAYLRFFLDDTVARLWLQPIEAPEEIQWLENAENLKELQKQVNTLIQPMKVTRVNESCHNVVFTALKTNRLVEIEVNVMQDGLVEAVTEEILLKDLPVTKAFDPWHGDETLKERLSGVRTGLLSVKNIIERVSAIDESEGKDMEAFPIECAWEILPFYNKFRLLKSYVWTGSPHRSLACYADDGTSLIRLYNPTTIYSVNKLESLQLDFSQITAYVRFFLDDAVAQLWLHIVESPREVHWIQKVENLEEIQKQVKALLHPIQVTRVDDTCYSVVLTAIKTNKLVEIELKVRQDGRVEAVREEILKRDLPVPRTLHQWETNESLEEMILRKS